jgi:hypothetical protein
MAKKTLSFMLLVFTLVFLGCYKDMDCRKTEKIKLVSPDSSWFIKLPQQKNLTIKNNIGQYQTITNGNPYNMERTRTIEPLEAIAKDRCKIYETKYYVGSCNTSIYPFTVTYNTEFNPFAHQHNLVINYYDFSSRYNENITINILDSNLIYEQSVKLGYLAQVSTTKDTAQFYKVFTNTNGITFNQVYVLKFKLGERTSTTIFPVKVWFSKEIGVIGYKLTNNVEWHVAN